jgi:hypothetical protein
MLSLLAVFPLIEHCTSIRNKQKVFGFLQQWVFRWDMTPHSLVIGYQHFKETCSLV